MKIVRKLMTLALTLSIVLMVVIVFGEDAGFDIDKSYNPMIFLIAGTVSFICMLFLTLTKGHVGDKQEYTTHSKRVRKQYPITTDDFMSNPNLNEEDKEMFDVWEKQFKE